MRLLFLTPDFPYPAHAGDRTYTAHLIETLAARPDLDLTVFCGSGFVQPPEGSCARWTGPRRSADRLAELRALLGPLPRATYRAMPPLAGNALAALLDHARFDMALINLSVMAPAIEHLHRHGVPAVYISHNLEADIRPEIAARASGFARRFIMARDASKYRRSELELLRQVQGVSAITAQDQARYAVLAPQLPGTVTPPGHPPVSEAKALPMALRKPTAVLVGSFLWNAKIANLREILAAYEHHRSATGSAGFTLRIAGRAAEGVFKKLAFRHPDVEFIDGFATLSDVVQDARIGLVLETMGGGFKLKTLDYVFSDLAIVAYPHAMAGSGLDAGSDYLAARGAIDAMKVIEAAIEDSATLSRVAARAKTRAADLFDWARNAGKLADFIQALVAKQPKDRA